MWPMSDSQFHEMAIESLMVREPTCVHPDTSVAKALDLMFEQKVSALPVVDDGKCVGIVTATDLVVLIRAITKVLQSEYPHYDDCLWAVDMVQKRAASDPIREIMSEVLVEASPQTSVGQAAALMVREGVHHLPVVDQGKLVGFLSSLDLIREFSD